MDVLKEEWEDLPDINWRNYFEGTVPSRSTKFWNQVAKYCDSDGNLLFKNIASFALRVLSLPFSNAVVERAFSFMNAIKTKVRNRMGLELLMSLMTIRLRLVRRGCCVKFVPSDSMLMLFNSSIYQKVQEQNSEEEILFDECIPVILSDSVDNVISLPDLTA